ncbi:Ankyrin [Mycena sanguinolenta]|uniref:Ankyrin n=1 Tax=Mycena sanguinolenta TaxID=230812 RepID=A0A8H6ZGC3_9AGAR|nr:Ankyrin [Mycena sanguinolenta]
MPRLDELPPELVLYISSFLTRETTIADECLPPECRIVQLELVPDLPSINVLSRTSTLLRHTLNQTLYDLCASVEPLGQLAILFAVEHELESTVEKLVAVGISLNTTFIIQRFGPCTLLCLAAAMGLPTMVVKLLDLYGEEAITKVQERCPRRRALDYAIRCRHMDVVRVLAPIPASSSGVRVSDDTQTEYLSHALLESASAGNIETSQYLVTEGAHIDFLHDVFYGVTSLFLAAGKGNLELVQFLLTSGADPNIIGAAKTPIIFNATSVDILQALVTAGANIHAVDGRPLNILAVAKNAEILHFCLERGVDPNVASQTGETALHRACWMIPSEAKVYVELLLQFGATTVENVDGYGSTPVDIAMSRGRMCLEVVNALEPHVRNPELRAKIEDWREVKMHLSLT